ncbi:MAG: TldD/PmbA family protein [Clostridia bacterium]|nr:TldD/PmbA family protein [Clostridia bacterium]MBQ8720062.1 TldD/PmbA family protein [Clostridia bacterium]
MMNFKILEESCRAAGINEVEVYRTLAEGAAVSTTNKELDQNMTYSRDEVYVRGVYDGHISTVYVENDSDTEIDEIVRRIRANSSVVESADPYFIYGGSKSYPEIKEKENDYGSYSQADMIELCRKMESFIYKKCEFIVQSQAAVEVEVETVTIENSNGLSVKRRSADALVMCVGVVRRDGEAKQGYYVEHLDKLADVNYDKLYKMAVERPLSSIGAKSIPSAAYPVVFENSQFASLMGCFFSMFSADAVIKKLSLLEGKLGEQVFGSNITITDEPQLEVSPTRVSFDDEGVAAHPTAIVENGRLVSFLHNLKTAKILDTVSTGNGFKDSNGAINVSYSNLCIKPTDTLFEEMISGISDGVFITQMMGQHAGVNKVSGAFNLQASGYRIRDGKIAEPITLIVVSGNIIDLLNNVECIANDFEVSRKIGSPSVLVKSLSISGQ